MQCIQTLPNTHTEKKFATNGFKLMQENTDVHYSVNEQNTVKRWKPLITWVKCHLLLPGLQHVHANAVEIELYLRLCSVGAFA